MTAESSHRRGGVRTGPPPRYEFSTVDLRFESGSGRCAGRLYKPDRPTDPPVVVLTPGVGLTWRESLVETAERLAHRGYAAFVYDHRGLGTEGDDGVVSPARQRADLEAAIAEVSSLPDVDGGRLALWGIDLSAGTALAVAAEEYRVRAVVARFPVLDGGRLVPGWVRPRLRGLGLAAGDRLLAVLGRGTSIPVFGDPGETALVTASGAARGASRLGDARDRRTPARSLWALWRHDVSDSLDRVSCPTLFVAGTRDDIAPAPAVATMSERVSNASLVRVPVGHYDALSDPSIDRVLNHELAFLDAEL